MKRLFFISSFLLVLTASHAQKASFSHSIGANFYFTDSGYFNYTAVYSPRYNLVDVNDNSTLSIGTHLGLGFDFIVSLIKDESPFIIWDIPVVAEFNFGMGSSKNNKKSFGGFIGGGYGVHGTNIDDESVVVSGLVINGGFRFKISNVPISVRGSYLIGSGEYDDIDIFGIGISYMFGF